MDLTSAGIVSFSGTFAERWKGKHTLVELGLGILQNIPRNARLVDSLGDAVLEDIQQVGQVLIPALTELLSLAIRLGQNPQQRDVILPVVAGATEVRDSALDIDDLAQQLVVHVALDAEAIVQGQAGVEREPLEVRGRIELHGAVLAVLQQLLDACRRLQVDDGHVRLHGGSVQRRGGGFAAALARLVPG